MKPIARGWCDLVETLVIVRLDSGEVWRHGVTPEGAPVCEASPLSWQAESFAAKRYAASRGLVEMPRKVAVREFRDGG